MHQVSLGFAKVLTQAVLSKIVKNDKHNFNHSLTKIMVPYENLHKPKSVTELSFWKATDYRLFLFHLGPLLLQQFSLSDSELAEIFCRVSFAIRVLSEQRLNDSIISHAEKQIKICLEKFLKVFSPESQSFNLHTIRHLVEQAKK